MQVVQRLTTVARQSKFSELSKLDRYPGTDSLGEKADFFFDDQGTEIEDAADIRDFRVIYSAAVVLLPQTTVPAATNTQVVNPNIATINIIIKKNSAKVPLKVVNAIISNNGL